VSIGENMPECTIIRRRGNPQVSRTSPCARWDDAQAEVAPTTVAWVSDGDAPVVMRGEHLDGERHVPVADDLAPLRRDNERAIVGPHDDLVGCLEPDALNLDRLTLGYGLADKRIAAFDQGTAGSGDHPHDGYS